MTSQIGLHFAESQYSEAQRAQHMAWLRKIKPAWVNILGGAQYDQARMFAAEIQRELPDTGILFRHYKDNGDDGLWTRITPQWFVDGLCKTYYQNTGWYVVTDNEANAGDLTAYANWTRDVIEYAAKAGGIRLAVGRFPTHNPALAQVKAGQLDNMWRAIAEHSEFVIWSPNVYYSKTNFDGLTHIQNVLAHAQKFGSFRTVLGEYAYAMNLDPHKGYASDSSISSVEAFSLGYNALRQTLPHVAACWYCVGDWPIGRNGFGVNGAILETLAQLPEWQNSGHTGPSTPPNVPAPISEHTEALKALESAYFDVDHRVRKIEKRLQAIRDILNEDV